MKTLIFLFALLYPVAVFAQGNTQISSFNKAKKALQHQVYFDHRTTIYCGAEFDEEKYVTPPSGFTTDKYVKRSKKIEWEHIVPAENFGRTFAEYRDGHPQCVNSKGKVFKGRRCAEKVNMEFRHMQADMYNLFPAIGAVNALRSNYNFVAKVDASNDFGSCAMKIDNRKAEPPEAARGRIARTYLYMHNTYKRYNMSRPQAQLMNAWDKMYPTSKWECVRYQRIKEIQKNDNSVMASRCK